MAIQLGKRCGNLVRAIHKATVTQVVECRNLAEENFPRARDAGLDILVSNHVPDKTDTTPASRECLSNLITNLRCGFGSHTASQIDFERLAGERKWVI